MPERPEQQQSVNSLHVRPVTLKSALAFVRDHHRHSPPPRGHRFSIGAVIDGELVGVAIVGRPVARMLDDGLTAEVLRCCTDGTRNCCSLLYGAARRAAKAMGYRCMLTYTRVDEPGTSLKAAGWRVTGQVKAEGWGRPSREREDRSEITRRQRWECDL